VALDHHRPLVERVRSAISQVRDDVAFGEIRRLRRDGRQPDLGAAGLERRGIGDRQGKLGLTIRGDHRDRAVHLRLAGHRGHTVHEVGVVAGVRVTARNCLAKRREPRLPLVIASIGVLRQQPAAVGRLGTDASEARPSVLHDRRQALAVGRVHPEQVSRLGWSILPRRQGGDERRARPAEATVELVLEARLCGAAREEGIGGRELAGCHRQQLVPEGGLAHHGRRQREAAERRRPLRPADASSEAIEAGRWPLTRTPPSS
jgi:hypothetical protein